MTSSVLVVAMELKNLKLKHFRNYEAAEVTFSPGINVLVGANAQGKTSLLEAIYVLALARSHRTKQERDLIQWGASESYLAGEVRFRQGQRPLSLTLWPKGKIARANHLELPRLSDYIGQLRVVLFAPEDLTLLKGPPAERRQFIDRELSQMNPLYLHELLTYQHELKQRNAYLKQLRKGQAKDRTLLDILTEQLAASGARMLAMRQAFVEQLEAWAGPVHEAISDQKEKLTLAYDTRLPWPKAEAGALDADPNTQAQALTQALEENLLAAYEEQAAAEIERGTTLLGPHRDDLLVYINGQEVKRYGSQGQQRTGVLSMKLAELDCMAQATGEYPLLLLDDVLSELDAKRQTLLLQVIEDKVQTFLTTTSLEGVNWDVLKNPHGYRISQGQVEPCEIKN